MLFSRSSLVSLALAASSIVSVNAAMEMQKRQLLGGVLCGIGLINNCGSTTAPINTLNDPSNCGTPGFVCPADVVNNAGSSTCVAGQCSAPCAAGTAFSPATGGCINTANIADSKNCGSAGTVCNVANGSSQCVAGSCSAFNCASGFTLVQNACETTTPSNDVLNCGSVGTVCPLINGASSSACVSGTCRVGGCAQGFVFALDTCNFVDVNSDPANCGAIGLQCGASSLCNTGVCTQVNCQSGAAFNPVLNACQVVSNDPLNCGAIGNVCPTRTGSATTCTAGECVTSRCSSPFVVVNGACALAPSQAPRVGKRGKVAKRDTICPGEETACPIVGSASFLRARSEGFSAFKSDDVAALNAAGGYECLDTRYSLESCGGCSSMGEFSAGVNCLALPNSSGVGCDNGTCVVFSCKANFRPNANGTACVQVTSPRRRSNVSARSHVARSLSHGSH